MALLALAFAGGVGLGYLVWGRQPAEQAQPSATPTTEPRRYDISLDDDPSIGPADAPITLIEFSDFNCPYCRRWHQQTLPALMAAYGDKIHFVYRDLPVVGGGAVGALAAQAANCAGDQGAYWEFHDAVFSAQYGLSREAYLQYAADLGLDGEALTECLDTGYYEQEVRDDLSYAYGLGINSTPTFFLNGIAIIGAQPTDVFTTLIDSELGN